MIKNYNQFINEDIRNKTIFSPAICDNLKRLCPDIQLRYNNEYKIVISSDKKLKLNKEFYKTLKKDHINKGDIVFENCKDILLHSDTGFTSIKEYGVFGDNINCFSCQNCYKLTSLDGAPKEVGGGFYCYGCELLTSLEGAPKKVGGFFNCSGCLNLTSLQGAPKEVSGGFYCQGCENLTSLEFTPKEVSGNFNCSHCKKLTSLKFAPEKVSGNFDCYGCKNLTSLQDAPEIVNGGFNCSYCDNLTNIEGAPETVGGEFGCSGCNPNFIKLTKAKYGKKVKDK